MSEDTTDVTTREELERLLPDSANMSDSDFGELRDGWYANILFTDGWIHPETPSRLRDSGWFIEDAYRYGDESLIVRVERSVGSKSDHDE